MRQYIVKCARPPVGHRYWGLTVFRCTYREDEAWSRLIQYMEDYVRKSTNCYGAPELMDSFDLKVHHEPSVLEGASKAFFRQKFLD